MTMPSLVMAEAQTSRLIAQLRRQEWPIDCARLDGFQIAFAVGGFVEHSPAAAHWLGPQRIAALVPIRADLGAAGELAEVRTRHFGIGMVERIEWKGHRDIESSLQWNERFEACVMSTELQTHSGAADRART
jgi:hypothetical protein